MNGVILPLDSGSKFALVLGTSESGFSGLDHATLVDVADEQLHIGVFDGLDFPVAGVFSAEDTRRFTVRERHEL